ncbi:MAG: prepilin peptidase [Firmicutes bacterium]|nr:prepilin peptidase [Bacillota bacterium]
MKIIGLSIFTLALLIGSFLNVCIYRIPNKQSIAYPPSHCPKCDTSLKPVDLIPVISYFLNKGKCRYCGEPISPQYPIVEIMNGLLYLILYLKFGLSLIFVKYAILTSLLIVVSFIDYKFEIIPNGLMIFGIIIGLIFNIMNFNTSFVNGIIGLFLGGGIFLIIAFIGPMGGGDIKLMGVLGLIFGGKGILLIALLSFIIGAISSIILILIGVKGRKDTIPFGPFISIAAVVTMLYGNEILRMYLEIIL